MQTIKNNPAKYSIQEINNDKIIKIMVIMLMIIVIFVIIFPMKLTFYLSDVINAARAYDIPEKTTNTIT
jgi:hypothetical protein